METVVISPKYKIVIPKSIRESMHLYAGEKVIVLPHDGRVELIPERSLKDMHYSQISEVKYIEKK